MCVNNRWCSDQLALSASIALIGNFYDSTWGTFIALTESLDEVPEEFMQEDDIGTLPAGGQITFVRRARNSKIITAKAVNGANSRRLIAGF